MRFLVTGGSGFLGTNITRALINEGHDVTVIDNLGRPGGGAALNLEYLKSNFAGKFSFVNADITDLERIKPYFVDKDFVYHLAAQTAVTKSLDDPVNDFRVNALGSFNVMEAARTKCDNAVMIYTSTNKIYGDLASIGLVEKETRWDFADQKYLNGVDESQPIDPESPYGCSKYAGDAYFQDYHHTFGMKTIVFRCSAMYGGLQRVLEDQGWIGWFLKLAAENKPATIYGDGKQVRDVLFIDDVVRAFKLAGQNVKKTAGQVYNMGGGRDNSLSILELISLIKKDLGRDLKYSFAPWRRADQKVYISNTAKAARDFGWKPLVTKKEGVKKQFDWISSKG